ncbi:NRDE family protein [Marinomonas sp. TI.3.20]|uniref:NRDE family protein n=1 Tax=Marinomonas sp. TI.3.20 TaxID=3121296 RepID=UPI00311D8899
MCSVSWLLDNDGYQVFFNRDEQKTRALALPPKHIVLQDVAVLMPIDPVAKGSWISVNEYGLTLCLLNNYQGQAPSGVLISRGQLVKLLSKSQNLAALEYEFSTLNLARYAPFTLLVFDAELNNQQGKVMAFEWDGMCCNTFPEWSPRFSSGMDLDKVKRARNDAYQDCIESGECFQNLLTLHASHHPDHLHKSFCMHREDAHTVSFTHVQVTARSQSMSYVAGSPCENLTQEAVVSNRIPLLANATPDLLAC